MKEVIKLGVEVHDLRQGKGKFTIARVSPLKRVIEAFEVFQIRAVLREVESFA